MALHSVTGIQNNASGKYIAQGPGQQYNADTINFHHGSLPLLRVLPVAVEAPFNSVINQYEPTCLPDTRVGILKDIISWADGQDQKRIFWLNGIAGIGKSTIARTIARCYDEKDRLGASFFFSRGNADVSHAGKFFTSIAVQLAEKSEVLKGGICEAISRCPDIESKAYRDQWTRLILKPLSVLHDDSHPGPLLLVIDALDECDGDDNVTAILECLAQLNTQDTTRLRVFITSRPEIPIRMGFRNMPGIVYHDLVLHNVPRHIVDHDIAIFFKEKFREMRGFFEHLDPDWPGDRTVDLLVQRAEGLFIYASTVCRFVKGDQEWPPQDLLEVILSSSRREVDDINFESPTLELDKMYIQVLKHSLKNVQRNKDKVAENFRQVVGSIVVLYEPLSEADLPGLLALSPGIIDTRLKCLHSVFKIPKKKEAPIHLLHLSFRDFLLDKTRFDKDTLTFWIDERQRHRDLFKCCLRLLSGKLRKDMLGLQAPGSLVDGRDRSQVEQHIPPDVRYACLYWIKHLQKSGTQLSDNGQVHQFLLGHLLHWLEALSWIGRLPECVAGMIQLENGITAANSPHLHSFIHDANRFALYHRSAIERAPLQLYVSALVFTPQNSIVRRQFKDEVPSWIQIKSKIQADWDGTRQTLEGHSDAVTSVAFSPDGSVLASASGDRTVRLWDAATGAARQTLQGHSGAVSSVAFSPDGSVLASASYDRTVKLWDAATGAARQTLDGHSSAVTSVAFSQDGIVLASASNDGTVRLWDAATGAARQTLEGHSQPVASVAFSPDGSVLASASDDRTVRLWDAATGAARLTLEGHSTAVRSVAFSPDGSVLASASYDETVRLWDAATGAARQTLEGHSQPVASVAFSPDGSVLASASDDGTVRLWNAATGAARQTLEGHSSAVSSVAFSPDGSVLASASYNGTVRLWDAATGAARQTLEGHTDAVTSVAFSPDGSVLASASYDRTVRLWDAATGAARQTLEGHSSAVSSVAFSPDGSVLASASYDRTVRLWDAATGAARQTLEGHSSAVSSVAFSPDGSVLASASYDRTVRLWDAATGAARQTLEGHTDAVSSVAFSPDGSVLASASYDRTVRLWDTATGAARRTLELGVTIHSMSFSSSGQYINSNRGSFRLSLPDTTSSNYTDSSDACLNTSHTSLSNSTGASVGFSVVGEWIMKDETGVLLLPPDYRADGADCVAILEAVVVLGRKSGRISILRFAHGSRLVL